VIPRTDVETIERNHARRVGYPSCKQTNNTSGVEKGSLGIEKRGVKMNRLLDFNHREDLMARSHFGDNGGAEKYVSAGRSGELSRETGFIESCNVDYY